MRFYSLLITFVVLLTACNSDGNSNSKGETGESQTKTKDLVKASAQQKKEKMNLSAFLEIDEEHLIPFKLLKNPKEDFLIVKNGSEEIKIKDYKWNGDMLNFTMPVFNSEISATLIGENFTGEWVKNPRTEHEAKMNFHAYSNLNHNLIPPRFTDYDLQMAAEDKPDAQIGGKWSVKFSPDTDDEYPAIGEFNQTGNDVTGTFRTETGDYRFLAGKIYGEQFYLSCFDGSHAFLFNGKVAGDKITGEFFSGKGWREPFTAKKDAKAKLTHPDALTYLNNKSDKVDFSFSDLNGQNKSFDDLIAGNKALVVQIFGSWCPNCMDETRFYTDLYKDYKAKGIEFVGVAYERNGTLEADKATLDKYIKELNMNYPVLYAGKASKKLASEQFSMLNKIISFPTTIFIDKDGKVHKVHTGFNGPATSVYKNYVKETKALLDKLAI